MWFSIRSPLITLWPIEEFDQKPRQLPAEQLICSAQIPLGQRKGNIKHYIYSILPFCCRTVPQNSISLLMGYNPQHLKLGYWLQRGENPHEWSIKKQIIGTEIEINLLWKRSWTYSVSRVAAAQP